jgi:hypothetical protein
LTSLPTLLSLTTLSTYRERAPKPATRPRPIRSRAPLDKNFCPLTFPATYYNNTRGYKTRRVAALTEAPRPAELREGFRARLMIAKLPPRSEVQKLKIEAARRATGEGRRVERERESQV